MSSSNDERRQQRIQFATRMGLDPHSRQVRQIIPGQCESFRTVEDEVTAQEILAKAKSEKHEGLSLLPRTFMSKSKRTAFTYKEISAALLSVVQANGRPGVVEVLRDLLLEENGDINLRRRKSSNLVKKIKKVDQDDQRSEVLTVAVERGMFDVARLLIPYADQTSLDESLSIILRPQPQVIDLTVLEILLGYGANASVHHEAFINAVSTHNTEVVALMLNAPSPVNTQCVSGSLWHAVQSGFLDTVFLLVLAGADGESIDGKGMALKDAVKSGRQDFLIAITLCNNPPSPASLDEAVFTAFSETTNTDLIHKLQLMDILLRNGARGPSSDLTLVHVTDECVSQSYSTAPPALQSMMELLVRWNASINYKNGAALKQCVSRSRIDLLDILLAAKALDANIASEAFSMIDLEANRQSRLDISSKLLARGAFGTPLHELLIYAVNNDDIEAVKLLVGRKEQNRASVDYRDAEALQNAVCHENINLVELLLSADPSPKSLAKAFPHIRKTNKENRLLLTRLFLDQGTTGIEVDRALEAAAAETGHMRDRQLIQLLVNNGADVSSNVQLAVSQGDETLTHILLKGNPSVAVVSEALPAVFGVEDLSKRLRVTSQLLSAGADVNSDDGKAILLAVQYFDMAALDILLERCPRAESLNAAFTAAMAFRDSRKRLDVCEKLIRAGVTGGEVSKALIFAVTREPHNLDFFKLVIQNASVDYEGGHAICVAVADNLQDHVLLLLEMGPQAATFENAFTAAMALPDTQKQLEYSRVLLRAKPQGDSASIALLNAVISQKMDLCRLFLQYEASVDFKDGASVVAAVVTENSDILKLLVEGQAWKPSTSSLIRGFEVALNIPVDIKKIEFLRIILESGLRGEPLDAALIESCKKGDNGLSLSSLLLSYSASVNYQKGEAIDIATRSGYISVLELLLRGGPSGTTLLRAFDSSQLLDENTRLLATKLLLESGLPIAEQVHKALLKLVQEPTPDLLTIELLLKFGASIHYQNHASLLSAAQATKMNVLGLLLNHVADPSATSIVFADRLQATSFWMTQNGLLVMEMLLANGAKGSAVDEALIIAVSKYEKESSAKVFLNALLRGGANVNYKNGLALQMATTIGNFDLIRSLLTRSPTAATLSLAFPFLFLSKADLPTTVALVKLFGENPAQNFKNLWTHPKIPDPVVFLCVKHYPRSPEALKAVLAAGFPVDQKKRCKIKDTDSDVTTLFWALSLPEKAACDSVIESLIDCGAAVNGHPEPLLHMAIEEGRYLVVAGLIGAGADANLIDSQGRTPLTFATEKGDLKSMKALLLGGAEGNDSSLHLAARMLNADAISLLIQGGHDPNKPSAECQGRTPLAELCYTAPSFAQHPTEREMEKDIRKAIRVLIDNGARTDILVPNKRIGGRSALLQALSSSRPYVMTKAFLDCGLFNEVNEEFNLYVDHEYTYSPAKYIEKGLCPGDVSQRTRLIELLRSFQARDRFWKNDGEQPADMVDPPEHILQEERQRKAMLVERARILEQQDFRHMVKIKDSYLNHSLQERQFRIDQDQKEERHRKELQYRSEVDDFESESFEKSARQKLTFQDELHARHARHLDDERRGRENELSIEERRIAAKMRLIEGQNTGKERELGIEERKIAAKMRLIEGQNAGKERGLSIEERKIAAKMRLIEGQNAGKERGLSIEERRMDAKMRLLEGRNTGKEQELSIEERRIAAKMRLLEGQNAGKERDLSIEERRIAAQMRLHGSQMELNNNQIAWGAEATRFMGAISTFNGGDARFGGQNSRLPPAQGQLQNKPQLRITEV